MMSHMLKPATVGLLILLPGLARADDPIMPPFDAASFDGGQPNAYFPLGVGHVSILTGTIKTDDGGAAPFNLIRTIVGPGPVLLGVQTTAIRDDELEDGLITESSVDYYATDRNGAVWYFGEDVTAYEYDDNGILTTTKQAPSWTAGVDQAQPGIVIEAVPDLSKVMFRANAPSAKETEYSAVETVGGTLAGFSDVVIVYTESTADPDLRERSAYAKGIGLVQTEEDLSAAKDNPKVSATMQP
jgi:hypothetical protein